MKSIASKGVSEVAASIVGGRDTSLPLWPASDPFPPLAGPAGELTNNAAETRSLNSHPQGPSAHKGPPVPLLSPKRRGFGALRPAAACRRPSTPPLASLAPRPD